MPIRASDQLALDQRTTVNVGRTDDTGQLTKCPTASGRLTRFAYVRALEADIKVRPLLEKARLTVQQVDNSELRLNAQSQVAFLGLVAAALNDELFGLHIAQTIDLRQIGLLYYVMASSDTLGEALLRASRYSTITNEAVRLKYSENRGVSITFEHVGVARHQDRHQIEFFAATLVRICRHLAGSKMSPLHVKLKHPRKEGVSQFEAFFDCDVLFASHMDEVAFSAAIRQTPLASADRFLNALLVSHCEDIQANRQRCRVALRSSVENEIAPLLPHGKAHAAAVARKLGTSQRTLARRLASEGLSFVIVLDELRCDLAKRYLREPALPISTIAWLLGYGEVSALTHAFKRWTGKTPRQMRAESNLVS
jgi:AraC-like DNA-binding protein